MSKQYTAATSAIEFDSISLCGMSEVKVENTRQFAWRYSRASKCGFRCSDYRYIYVSIYWRLRGFFLYYCNLLKDVGVKCSAYFYPMITNASVIELNKRKWRIKWLTSCSSKWQNKRRYFQFTVNFISATHTGWIQRISGMYCLYVNEAASNSGTLGAWST